MTLVYLVEGTLHDRGDEAHWLAKAFTTPAAAEQYRDLCQHYTEQYCEYFWAEFITKFGEPARGRNILGIHTAGQWQGMAMADAWFGYCCPDDHPGKLKMRAGSPDPKIEMPEGKPCRYRVVEVELVDD